ncbi:hypothetical protein Tcan_09856 [Toxocara canis]|uniref:Uncharacterized protein n=1 Tax=Toxocara canis TaxID=6265 RepID=A0A0B2VIC7_TOXCA|nr:hypothetical protein Tcan_09856 [Toxocara canis]
MRAADAVIGEVTVRLLLLSFAIVVQQLALRCAAIPRRGNEPWSVILCKFADVHYEPRAREWFTEWMIGTNGVETIERYFSDVSNNIYTITGTRIHGWFTLPWTRKQVRRMASEDNELQDSAERDFALYDKTKELCVKLALKNGETLHSQKITIINAENNAVYGKKHGVLLTPKLIFSSVLTHEMVHSFYIGHSYSDRNIKVFPHSRSGEYDDKYDLMSTANALMHPSPYGLSGPGLNGPHLDYLGWLPMNRVVYFGRDGRHNYTLRFSSLSVPHKGTTGWLLALIPYDRDDPGNVYTVEYRTPNNYDQGIKQGAVVIHRVQRVGSSYYSVIVTHSRDYYELIEGTEWIHFLDYDSSNKYQYIRVRVEKVNRRARYADVTVVSTFDPIACRSFEAKRVLNDEERKARNTTVEHICVPRSYAKEQDFLIEKQEKRNRLFDISEDNKLGDSRIAENGCQPPYVPRNAFVGDEVCVTKEESKRIQTENDEQHSHMRYYAFFNGQDTIGI